MRKVLFVDDERLIIQGFLHSVDWENYGYHVSTAESAKEALRICKTVIPDIAILDINMSDMNGLELGGELKKINPDIFIILLSAYSDFSYAREAVRKQFDEYLLKPEVEFEDILETMERFSPQITVKLKDQMVKTGEKLWRILQKICKREGVSNSKLTELLVELVAKKIQMPYGCYYIRIDSFHLDEKAFDENDRKAFDMLSDFIDYQGIIFQPSRYICVMLKECENDTQSIRFAEEIVSMFDESNITVTIGVSPCFPKASQIYHAYLQSRNALLNKFYVNEQILQYQGSNEVKTVNVKEYIDSAEKMLLSNDLAGYQKLTLQLLANLLVTSASKGLTSSTLLKLLMILIKKTESKGTSLADLIGRQESDLFEEINQCRSFEEMEGWFRNIFDILMEYMLSNECPTKSELINEVLKYMGAHYEDPELSLDKTARNFYISYAYLSYLFSKEMNESFSHSLTLMRMEKAKQLILENKLKLADIALKCGYNNTSYFIKVFKRITGMTPYKYRMSLNDYMA